MLYALLILAAIMAGVLILHLRLRGVWNERHRLVSLSLGRHTGVELDFLRDLMTIRLAGVAVHRRPLSESREPEAAPEIDSIQQPAPPKSRRRRQRRSLREIFEFLRELLPPIRHAVWNFLRGLVRAGVIEEMEARVEAGFDSPDRTGMAFGYYQAILGITPAMAGRLVFVPDWMGASFSASGRLTVSIPLYRMVWRILVLLWQLPSRKIFKMAIHKEKGAQDG